METFTVRGSGPAAYERYLVPVVFRPLAERLLARAGVRPGERLLDVACGTGIVARTAAAKGVRSTGTDLKPGMLATARELAPAIEWVSADAAALPMPDASYDVVVCQQGLQFMPEPGAALTEMHRVLAPGGRLVLALWRALEYAPGFAAYVDVLDRHLGAQVAEILRAAFSAHNADRVRSWLTRAGFADPGVAIELLPARFGSAEQLFEEEVAATPLADAVAAAGQDRRRDMAADLAGLLADRTDDDGLLFPIEAHLFTASR
jgi:SAM-dependent methyltransferase